MDIDELEIEYKSKKDLIMTPKRAAQAELGKLIMQSVKAGLKKGKTTNGAAKQLAEWNEWYQLILEKIIELPD